MNESTARNLTNRTIECPLPGGRWLRLSPRETVPVSAADGNSPLFKKLVRRRMIEVLGPAEPSAAGEHVDKKEKELVDREKPVDEKKAGAAKRPRTAKRRRSAKPAPALSPDESPKRKGG